jgi:hypothetical protein
MDPRGAIVLVRGAPEKIEFRKALIWSMTLTDFAFVCKTS